MPLEETGKVFPYQPWMREEDLPSPIQFPSKEMSREEVIRIVKERLAGDAPPGKNFYVLGPEPHSLSKEVFNMTFGHQAGFYKDIYPGTYQMGHDVVRMVGSLLGADDPGGFLTPGGTESNLYSVRLARNLAKKSKPELVMLETGHYSLRLAGELFGVKVRTANVNSELTPEIDRVEKLINENTVMLTCTAPETSLGVVDPVEEFGELAEKHGLYFHVDSALGGFMLPFLRELGYNIPPFDFRVPQVNSMTADAHKYGMQMRPTSCFIIRDREYLNAIPVEETLIPYLSGTSRLGASAVSLWALITHLGWEGYKRYVKNAMDLAKTVIREINGIDGLKLVREPTVPILAITSDRYDVAKIERKTGAKGWVTRVGTLPHTKTKFIRIYIHPLKTRETVEKYLEDLRDAVKAVNAET